MKNTTAVRKMDLGIASKSDSNMAAPTSVGQVEPNEVHNALSLHGGESSVYEVRHKGRKIGTISKETSSAGRPSWSAQHDVSGGVKGLPTQGEAKAQMASMHAAHMNKQVRDYADNVYGTAAKKDYSEEERKQLAKEGKALPDGSYPIVTGTDLEHAVELAGTGSDGKTEIKTHIKTRAKALGMESKIPKSWGAQKNDFAKILKVALPDNPLQSDPKNTDTMEEDPDVDSLQTPKPFSSMLRHQPYDRKKPAPYTQAGSQDVPVLPASALASSVVGTN